MADPISTPAEMSLPPAAAVGRRRASRRKPSADTIEVKQKFSSITISDDSDGDISMQDEASRQLVSEASAARGKGKGKGKGKVTRSSRDIAHLLTAPRHRHWTTSTRMMRLRSTNFHPKTTFLRTRKTLMMPHR